jgi:hypothetical protein
MSSWNAYCSRRSWTSWRVSVIGAPAVDAGTGRADERHVRVGVDARLGLTDRGFGRRISDLHYRN